MLHLTHARGTYRMLNEMQKMASPRMERIGRETDHNYSVLKARGFRLVKGWDSKFPRFGDRKPEYGQRYYDWQDHYYMLRRKSGSTVYVSEPYDICSDVILDLAKLIKDGWRVDIMVNLSLWNPGATTPIWITKECKESDDRVLYPYVNCDVEDCDIC